MIKYFVEFLTDAIVIDGQEVVPAKYLGWYAEKRVFTSAHKKLYVTTWNTPEEAQEEARKLREEFPEFADKIGVGSYVSYTEGVQA